MSTDEKEPKKREGTKPTSRQYCKSGHDTFVCGRDSQGHCKDCRANRHQLPKQILNFQGMYNTHHFPFTIGDYAELYMSQGQKCRICDTEGKDYPDGLFPDVDKKNEVRGLLCPPCYSMVRYLRNKTQILSPLVQYLKMYQ